MGLAGTNKRIRSAMRKKFLRVYREQNCNASQTRQILDLGLHTFDRWMKRYPKFAEKIIEIEEAMIDDVEVVLLSNAKAGKQRAIEFFLSNRRRKKYRNTIRSEITGAEGGPVTYKEEIYEPSKPPETLPQQEVKNDVEEKKSG